MKKFSITLLVFVLSFAYTGRAQTPVFPYVESFDSYPVNQPLNGDGGIEASRHVYVTPYGIVGNCAEFQMTDTAVVTTDTIVSPLIGPLTAHTVTSFYFRAVTFVGSVPSVYHMTYTDQAFIYVGVNNFLLTDLQYTIDSTDQNTTTGYVKVVVAAPSQVSGHSGQFKIIASNPAGNNWRLEFDSLVVKDTLPIPPVLTDSVTNVTCRGSNTGGIKVFASGATAPYTYLWSPGGDTTAAISGVAAGIYSVTVTDHQGATASLTDSIRQPALALILDSLDKTDALCYGSSSGTATIYASGGTMPYSYVWSTSPPTHSNPAEHLSSGNYTVTVTDAHSCSVSASVQISQPSNALTTTTTSTQSTLGNNGTASVIASGGTGTILYAWSTNPVQTTDVATGLAPGLYEVTVTNGTCVIVDTAFVAFPAGISEDGNYHISVHPNPASDQVYVDVTGMNASSFVLSIADMSGRVVVAQQLSNSIINTSSLSEGVYIIRLSSDGVSYMSRLVVQH